MTELHTPPTDTPSWMDRLNWVGATASLICAIHCLAMPLLIGVLPILGLSLLASSWLEWSLIGFTGAVGLFTLIPSYHLKHRRLQPLTLFLLGFGLILGTKFLLDEGSSLETSGLVTGALFVAGANLTNHRLTHTCTTCRH